MSKTRVNIFQTIKDSLPLFIREQYPLFGELLEEYYLSLEKKTGVYDILTRINEYLNLDELSSIVERTSINVPSYSFEDQISVISTEGFPQKNGLIKIEDEIVFYKEKTDNSFLNCARGFSGVDSFGLELSFSSTESSDHESGTTVYNLYALLLKEFLNKIKVQLTPGFEGRDFFPSLNEGTFIKQSSDFYKSKGSDESFRILFNAIFGSPVTVIKPRESVIEPSSALYSVTNDIVVESVNGNPEDCLNKTLYQKDFEGNLSYGSVTNVEKINRSGRPYYILSIDFDYNRDTTTRGSIYGKFLYNETTISVEDYTLGEDSSLWVDSTIGFENVGSLYATLPDGDKLIINYSGIVNNQFLNISNINRSIPKGTTLVSYNFAYVFGENDSLIELKILPILADYTYDNNSISLEKGDKVLLSSLGEKSRSRKSNDWIFNLATTNSVKQILLLDLRLKKYKLSFYENSEFYVGDEFILYSSIGDEYNLKLISRDSEFDYSFSSNKTIANISSPGFYTLRKLSKTRFANIPLDNRYSSNIQNVYLNSTQSELYVSSGSIPFYGDSSITIPSKIINFSGNYPVTEENYILNLGKHPLNTGDIVIYSQGNSNRLSIDNGSYYVKVVDRENIKLATSQSKLFNEEFVKFSGNIRNNKLYYVTYDTFDVSYLSRIIADPENFFKIGHQRLIKKFEDPINTSVGNFEIKNGPIGLFKNGVEIISYKSNDSIYYGDIKSIEILSEGSDYDVLNPPKLVVEDLEGYGEGCEGFVEVSGSLDRIDILNPGIGFFSDPLIKIIGGNGKGAKINPVKETRNYSSEFDASNGNILDISTNTINFPFDIYFVTGERVRYFKNNGILINGLNDTGIYYVRKISDTSIKLYRNYRDSVDNTNPIDFTSYGYGIHRIEALEPRKLITKFDVVSGGENYRNKKIVFDSNSNFVNIYNDTISLKNHGFSTGDIVKYSVVGTAEIQGLSNNSLYYTFKVDNDTIKLCEIGTGNLQDTYYLNNKIFLDISSNGNGIHTIEFEPIQIIVTDLDNRNNTTFSYRPVFKGRITSVWIYKQGNNYGSSEIINYNRQPKIYVENGKNARIKPIISNGSISSIIIENSGFNYFSIPEIQIFGSGSGAKLIPVLTPEGLLDEVIIENSGIGYDNNTTLVVRPSGNGVKFFARINTWNINLVEREYLKRLIPDDDGFLYKTKNIQKNNYKLKYTHAYAPRKLREYILTKRVESGIERYIPDINFSNLEGRELDSKYHSPILGWSYDGNPIYGPYGFSNADGTGSVKRLKSGYSLVSKQNRPNEQLYPLGYFVEDYEYFDLGDLDIHNGRFCVTPEYPNGVYAYFCTIGDVDPAFKNYRKPEFPYVIGNTFKSKPIDFNYSNIDQLEFDFSTVFRNTSPYNIFEEQSGYDFINQYESIKSHSSIVDNTTVGSIKDINIISRGSNYKVNDKFEFNNEYTTGFGVKASVDSIKGKKINSVGYAITTIRDVTLTNYGKNQYVAITSSPHNLDNGTIFLYDETESRKFYSLNTEISRNTVTLSNNIGNLFSTGITTYINVVGDLNYPKIITNDILQLENEQLKVLEVDQKSSRLRVLRGFNSTTIVPHNAGIGITENSRKLLYTSGPYSEEKDRQIYFDPKESLGIGIGTTATIKNPGSNESTVFIESKRIYLLSNKLDTNTKLVYNTNGGFPIGVSLGSTSFRLNDGQVLYAYRFSDDFIGITTTKSSISSTGEFIGIGTGINVDLLAFNDYGIGDYHSFTALYENTKKVSINQSYLTVTTQDNHELQNRDLINIDVKYNDQKSLRVVYNDENRRFGINPVFFEQSSVDVLQNTIEIVNHNFYNGEKVIHTSSQPTQGLLNDKIYYVGVIDKDRIFLSTTYENALNKVEINLTQSSFGNLLPINPTLKIERNKNIVFDLSDESLSYVKNNVRYSAFYLNLYTDKECTNKFISTYQSKTFNVIRRGKVGIDINAQLFLRYDKNIPEILYYKLDPVKESDIPNFKYEIILDDTNRNTINYVDSFYNKEFEIFKTSNKQFKVYLEDVPEQTSNLTSISDFTYTTKSKNASGEVDNIKFISKGSKFFKIPSVNRIDSQNGVDFFGIVESDNIGKLKSLNIQDIGNDFTSDITLRPKANLPISLKIEPLSSVERVDIISYGKNYTELPNLVLIDGFTNKPAEDLNLVYNEETLEVDIVTNTNGIYNVTPKIIPINNTNGFKILSLDYDDFTKDVTVVLDTVGFSTLSAFPFTIGSKVLIENVVTLNPETDLGYNSKNFDYALFTVVDNDPNIGGQLPSVTFNIGDYVGSKNPGVYDSLFTTARIIPESYFPVFSVILKKNKFFKNERVVQGNFEGIVSEWDPTNEYLKLETFDASELKLNTLISGESSKSFGTVSNIVGISTVEYVFNSVRTRRNKWKTNKGFLNDDNQRIQDSDYYQYFSYALNTDVQINSWDSLVQNLNHTAGFKRFSNLSVKSTPNNSGINSTQNNGDVFGVANIDGFADLNCIYDYDLVTENSVQIGINDFISDEIRFGSKLLQDYFESIGNRVLIVDEITEQFNSNPRATRFSIVDEFRLDEFKYKKYFIQTSNKLFTTDRQSIIVNLLQDGSYGYLNQYGRVETVNPHGYFDFSVFGSYGYLLYYPIEYDFEDYNISGVSLNIGEQLVGIGTTTLGQIVSIASTHSVIPAGSSSGVPITISNQSKTYRSVKYLITIEANDGSYLQADELNLIHDGTNSYISEFANLESSNFTSDVGVGFCTYYPQIVGSSLSLKLVPNFNPTQNFKVNVVTTSISDNSLTSIGQTVLVTSRIESEYLQIAGSSTPSPGIVTSIGRLYRSFYILASIEDSTNNIYQFSELVAVRDGSEVYFTEFGRVLSDESLYLTGIGTFTGTINGVNDQTELYFEPLANRNVNVRTLIYSLETVDLEKSYTSIDLDQSNVSTLYGDYFGTENDIKRSFELKYKGFPIFERKFDSQDTNTVLLSENCIRIPNHFFVSGEKIVYSINQNSFIPDSAIGIQTSVISGVSTDKLPNEVYVIKINESKIQFASTAENALKYNPEPLVLSSLGIGTQHSFTATNKDTKCLFTVDNMVQSPVVKTSVNFELDRNVTATDVFIKLSGISSIFAKDLLQINDEIMLVERVGVSSDELIRVRRRWMGEKGAVAHGIGSTVYKLSGNYTIHGTNVDFASAPYGKVPLSQPQNQVGAPIIRPDDRDFTGITTNSYFSGRVFLRRGEVDTTQEVYSNNVLFDDISTQFTGIKSDFVLKSNGSDVTGISTNNAIITIKDIFQQPARTGVASVLGNYTLEESSGQTKLFFYPSTQEVNDDINVTALPVGGVILSIGSTSGFGYQPLISAGGTATISGFGTITNISIGNSGSGYRSGIQTTVNVYAETSSSTQVVGIASISLGKIVNVTITNPGSGYTNTKPPLIRFDSPLGYSNIPLVYSSESVQGIGTGAKVDIVVSQDSSILDFNITNGGYAYKEGEILTVNVGGQTGIPTDLTKTLEEFQIEIKSIRNDDFSGWTIGDVQQLDPIDNLFNGVRRVFPIKFRGDRVSIIAKNGSNIDVEATLLIFINGILQIPGQSYSFKGGSLLIFSEPPKKEYTSNILFYRGTPNIDVRLVDIIEEIEVGDTAKIHSNIISEREESRQIEEILSADIVITNPYAGPGKLTDEITQRPVNICRQVEDLFINGQPVSKDRAIYEPLINPVSTIIQNVSTSSTDMFVESLKTFFDNEAESISIFDASQIELISQDTLEVGIATAIVSLAGSITQLDIINPGYGYTFTPTISISNPPEDSNGIKAQAQLTISNGEIVSYSITNSGRGYDTNNPPMVIIEYPKMVTEKIINVTYEGDFGTITGIAKTTVGAGLTAVAIDFYIDVQSYLRNPFVNSGSQYDLGISGISTGYFFVVSNSNIGLGITSLYNNQTILSYSEDYLNNVFQVYDLEIKSKNIPGIGTTSIVEVYTLTKSEIDLTLPSFDNDITTFDNDRFTFDSNSNEFSYFGNFSWGRIIFDPVRSRRDRKNFTSYYQNGYSGISTSALVKRTNTLKYDLYSNII